MSYNKILSAAKNHFILLYFFITATQLWIFMSKDIVSNYIFISAGIMLIAKWLWDWRNVFSLKKNDSNHRVYHIKYKPSKQTSSPTVYYDWQFKRLVTYILLICLLYIVYSFFQYYRNRNDFYLGDITFSEDLQREGYNTKSLELELREIKELIIQSQEFEMTRSHRLSLDPDFKSEQKENTEFRVEGFTFPLTKIGFSLAALVFGKPSKVNIAITSDSTRYIARVDIAGNAIEKFEEFFQDNIEKRLVFANLIKEIGYYILERTDPYVMTAQYIYYDDPIKALSIMPSDDNPKYIAQYDYVGQARVHSKLGDFKTAKEILREGIKEHPEISAFYVDLAILFFEQAKSDSGLLFLKRSLAINNNDGLVYQNIGNYYYYDKPNPDSAIYFLTKCLQFGNSLTNTDKLDALFKLSSCFAKKNNQRLQDSLFVEGCNLDPSSFYRLYHNRDSMKYSIVDIYDKPQNIPVSTLVTYSFRSKDFAESYSKDSVLLEKCLKRSSVLIPAKILLADYCYASANYFKGDSLINSVLLQQPNNYVAYYHQAQAYYNKDILFAETKIRESLQINPANNEAIDLLSNILIQRGEKNEFVANLQKLLWLSPNTSYYRNKMADFYYFEKNWVKSAYYYKLGMINKGNEPINIEGFFRLAESAFFLNDYYTAKQYYDSCLKFRWPSEYQIEINKNRNDCIRYLY